MDLTKIKNTEKLMAYIWLVVLILFMFLLVFSQVDFDRFLNSDTLYLPSIYKDIFQDGYGFGGWQLNPAPNFFPDMLGYFILEGICGGNFIIASFVYPIIQFFVLMLLFRKLFKRLFDNRMFYFNFITGVIFVSYFLFMSIVGNDFETTFQLLTNSYHLGALINTLWATLLMVSWVNSRIKSTFYLLLFLIIIAVISDKLFIIQFVLGALVLLFLRFYLTKNQVYKRDAFWVSGATIFGLVVFKLIQKIDWINFSTSPTLFSFDKIGESFIILIQHNWELISGSIFGFLIVFASCVTFIRSIYLFGKKIKNRNFDKQFYVFFGVFLFMFFTLIAPILNGSYNGLDCLRYTIGFYIIGLIFFPFLFSFTPNEVKKKNVFILLAIYSIIALTGVSEIKDLPNYFNYQDSYATTLDELKEEHNLKAGIADYWFAKKNMMFSEKDLRIYATHNDLDVYTHVTNRNWYRLTVAGDPVVFNFVIIDSDDRLNLVRKLFKEIEVIQKGEVRICITPDFVYPYKETSPHVLNLREEEV